MIQLTDNLFVTADERNYIVGKPRGKASKGSLLLSPSILLPWHKPCVAPFLRLSKSGQLTAGSQLCASLWKSRTACKPIL